MPPEAALLSAEGLVRSFGAERALGVGARLAGRYAEAAAHLNAALSAFTELGMGWQAGRTRFELGALAEAQAQTGAAREHYAAALDDFEALGAAPMAERARTRLKDL